MILLISVSNNLLGDGGPGPVLITAAVGHSHAITPTAAKLVNC